MITEIQRLANKIPCPACGVYKSLTAVLICERGEGKCKTECHCTSCDAKLIIDIPDGLSAKKIEAEKNLELHCDIDTQVCQISNGTGSQKKQAA